jgi:hypothetical protein
VDAIATPFVQGQLRGEPLTFLLETECAHCGQLLRIEIDSELNYRVLTEDADPVIVVPMVDMATLQDPSIIDAF